MDQRCVLLAGTGGASVFLGGAVSPICDKVRRCQSDSLLLLSSSFRSCSSFSLTTKIEPGLAGTCGQDFLG